MCPLDISLEDVEVLEVQPDGRKRSWCPDGDYACPRVRFARPPDLNRPGGRRKACPRPTMSPRRPGPPSSASRPSSCLPPQSQSRIGQQIVWSNDLLMGLVGDPFKPGPHAGEFLWWAQRQA
jgi:hypothetical protein